MKRRLWSEQPRHLVRPLALARPHLAADVARAEHAARQVVGQVLSDAAMDRLLVDVRADDCPPFGMVRP